MEYTDVERFFKDDERETVPPRFWRGLGLKVIVLLLLGVVVAFLLPLGSLASRLSAGAAVIATGASLLVVTPLVKRVERIAALATPEMQRISPTGGGALYRRNSEVVREMRQDARTGLVGASLFVLAGVTQLVSLVIA